MTTIKVINKWAFDNISNYRNKDLSLNKDKLTNDILKQFKIDKSDSMYFSDLKFRITELINFLGESK